MTSDFKSRLDNATVSCSLIALLSDCVGEVWVDEITLPEDVLTEALARVGSEVGGGWRVFVVSCI